MEGGICVSTVVALWGESSAVASSGFTENCRVEITVFSFI